MSKHKLSTPKKTSKEKRRIGVDKHMFVEDAPVTGEKPARGRDSKPLNDTMKKLARGCMKSERRVTDEEGKSIIEIEEQKNI